MKSNIPVVRDFKFSKNTPMQADNLTQYCTLQYSNIYISRGESDYLRLFYINIYL